jgi:hypothetical protein
MEIKLNSGMDAVSRSEAKPAVGRGQPELRDGVSFTTSRSLDQALAELPDVRADVVERARALISSAPYPPAETLDKLARLLALAPDEAESSRPSA